MPNETMRSRHIFIVATEESGDRLGAGLMAELRTRRGETIRFSGVGGSRMIAQGLKSQFPISDLSIIGFSAVVRNLRMILRRIDEVAQAALAAEPDMLVIVDSPDFTHRVARRVKKKRPGLPVVDYVAPTVWAWRPGRAKRMRAYVDHVLALLPFEPEAFSRLKGPPCSYVGHPLAQQAASLRPDAGEARAREATDPARLLVLPGSRRSEVRHHMATFGATLARLLAAGAKLDVTLPTTPHLREMVVAATAGWPLTPHIVTTEEEKRAAFRSARAALAKSGTVTLELALSGVPTVAAYKVGAMEAVIAKPLIRTSSVILANLVIGENVVPEFLQTRATPEILAATLEEVLADTPLRRRQIEAFAQLDAIMEMSGRPPSARAADIVLSMMK